MDSIDDNDLQVWMRPKREKKPSEFPHLNEELKAELEQLAEGLVCHIYLIDRQILDYRDALRLLQPHGSGRMDLRYWKKERTPGRHPTPFVWKRLTHPPPKSLNGEQSQSKRKSLDQQVARTYAYSAFKIPDTGLRLHAKRKGKFEKTLQQVKEVLGRIEKLLRMRATIFEALRKWRLSTSICITKQSEQLTQMEADVKRLLPEWEAVFDKRYEELNERKRVHLILLDEEDKRLAKKGYQFGTMPVDLD